ncbi:probable E3 ubiquitin-protein ligase ATL44 [Lolium perenne]|uniref:probable E3 ubiquitin-protein ligase ATL44 n=1 Tax=Lolium perenne TaxID=4522 RepID=UPI0021F5457E|nr:probable E3 ubiquitin-protein ligase ATL44 [Lolium perenne]
MQPSAGCWAARRLLASPAPTPADQSMDAERAHLERVLGVTTMVLLVASFSYLAVSTLYGCLRAARVVHAPPGNDDDPAPAETRDDTKRALDGIPVRVVVLQQFMPDADGGRNDDADADADDCAVCLAEFAAGDEVRVLPACRHGFHSECVDRWLLTRAPTCPVCRAPVAASGTKQDCAAGHGHDVGIGGDEYRASGAISAVSLVE